MSETQTPVAGESIAVVPDGRYWSVVAAERLPGYSGHPRTSRETLSGFYAYPFTREQAARGAAERIAREVGRKVL